jgi:Protein of unknown function (DUF3999)
MKTLLILFLSAAAIFTAAANAQTAKQFTLNDMAATMRIQPQANGGSLQRIPLPADLIMHSQSADLNDLRLFKSSGEPVPFALRSSETEATTTTATKVALRAFAIRESGKPAGIGNAAGNAAIRIEVRGDDMNVLIDRTAGSASTNEGGIVGVLLDTRAVEGVMTNIEFDIDLPPNQVVPLTVEASTNLSNWETIANARSVYRFSDASAPALTSVDLPSGVEVKGRYLRISWPLQKSASAVVIRGASLAMESSRRAPIAQPRRNLGAPTAATTHAQEWQLASPLRLRALALTTEQTGTLLPITVLGRDNDKQPWRRLADTVLFKLELADPASNKNIVSTNAPLALGNVSIRQLKIEAPASSAGIPANLISAAIEYGAQEMIAAVNPSEELTIAVGALANGREATRAALPLPTIVPDFSAQRVTTFALMTVREPTKFYPERLAVSSNPAPAERKDFILWGALLLGVGVLAAMAWGAVKQLRAAK